MKNLKIESFMLKLIMIPLLVRTSCVNEISEEPTTLPGEIPIRLSTQILCNPTRVIDNKFQEKDAIGLYVLTQPSTINQKRYIDNMRFTCSQTSGFEPEETIYYPKGNGECNFISYYPFQETGIEPDKSTMQVQIQTDQSTVGGLSLSDFMIAVNNDITPSQNMVAMEYKHKLCKLEIIIRPAAGEDLQELLADNPTLSLNGFHSEASYDFLTGQFGSSGQTSGIIPYGEWKIENNTLIGKKAILIPEKIESDSHYINMEIDGKSYSCPFPDNFQLSSEKSCSIGIIYKSSEGIQINNFDHSIADWTEGESGETTAQETSGIIHLAALKFSKSNVYKAINEGTQVAEICKEYLLADNIDAHAIVAYPVLNGKVSWNKVNNVLAYTPGNQSVINDFYIAEDNSISISKPENPLPVRLQEDVLTDIRNTETKTYPIVKIGIQYWMGRSLEAARYTDGKTITLKKDFTATAGYYTGKYQDAPQNFYFYNSEAVISGKLSPQGWNIPTETEWEQLKQYINNDASKLKSGPWSSDENGDKLPIFNTTGFNGMPEGYILKSKKGYTNVLYTLEYWTTKSSGNHINKAIYLLHTTNEIKDGNITDRALSVRCIRK